MDKTAQRQTGDQRELEDALRELDYWRSRYQDAARLLRGSRKLLERDLEGRVPDGEKIIAMSQIRDFLASRT